MMVPALSSLPLPTILTASTAPDAAGPLPAVLFYLFAAIVVGGALLVALSPNIVRSAVGLMFALAGMSGFYFLLHAEFVAAVQLVVYVGGTLILVIFGVMLTSKSPNVTYNPRRWEVLWALLVAVLIVTPLVALFVTYSFPQHGGTAAAPERYPVSTLGQALMEPSKFLVPFEVVSVVLLAVLIGAAYLAKSRRSKQL